MGRTFRKEKSWDDGGHRGGKNTAKKFNTRGVRVLNNDVEDDDDFDYEDFDFDSSDTHTTKNHTEKHTT